jgi:4a-hydroxytetrahydrobiopterin dehydratase
MSLLTPEVVDEKLLALHGWRRDGPMIVRDFEFADFAAAMGFVNKVAALAEQANPTSTSAITGCGSVSSLTTLEA